MGTRLCTCTCTLRIRNTPTKGTQERKRKGERERERERETRTSTRLYSRLLLLTWRTCRSIRTCDYQADPYCVFATEMERHSLQPAIVYAYVFRKTPARCPMSRKFCTNYFNHRAHRAFLIIGPGSGLSGIVKKIHPYTDSSCPFLMVDSLINLGSIFPGGEEVKISCW
jgi:hypothetical protein